MIVENAAYLCYWTSIYISFKSRLCMGVVSPPTQKVEDFCIYELWPFINRVIWLLLLDLSKKKECKRLLLLDFRKLDRFSECTDIDWYRVPTLVQLDGKHQFALLCYILYRNGETKHKQNTTSCLKQAFTPCLKSVGLLLHAPCNRQSLSQ